MGITHLEHRPLTQLPKSMAMDAALTAAPRHVPAQQDPYRTLPHVKLGGDTALECRYVNRRTNVRDGQGST